MKNSYAASSSFKMAALFTALLGVNIGVMAYFIAHFAGDAKMVGLSILAIGLMLAVILTSFLISVFVVSRTNRIALTAQNIMETGDLSRRIETDSRWDDLSRMSEVLNAFLDRNEELVEGVRRVSDNIAHDLRTPLTRLRNNLETLRKDGRDAEAIDALIGEADRLLITFNALLRIARIETARQRGHFVPVHLGRLLRDVADLYEPLAEEKGIRLVLRTGDGEISGDRDLLFQAFANILDNAIKFSSDGAAISVETLREGGAYTCMIRDEGPGIPPEERKKVFTRFYRGEQSRHLPGNGLGLSLVSAVAGLHNASLVLEDAAPGLCVRITFL